MCGLGLRKPVSHTSATPSTHTHNLVTWFSLTYILDLMLFIQPSWEHIDISVCICNHNESLWWSLWHYVNWISEMKWAHHSSHLKVRKSTPNSQFSKHNGFNLMIWLSCDAIPIQKTCQLSRRELYYRIVFKNWNNVAFPEGTLWINTHAASYFTQ